jgi:FAD/FMN-containing dehydrogenase
MSTTIQFEDSVLSIFGGASSAQCLRPNDAGFDDARRVWNGMIDRRPALIVRCQNRDDVVRAVGLARERGVPLAVRGGGHSAAGLAVCDGGVVVDLRAMRAVRVDSDRRIARAQGGATWADFDAAAGAHGLATTGGVISTTGVGGLTLGGGIGWLMRSYGLASDNVIAAELVTADGTVLTVSETEHPELFWAIRGGGGNFGVVTEFTFRLHPVPEVTGGMVVHPAARARDVLRHFRDITQQAPDALSLVNGFLTTPDGMKVTVIAGCYNGPESEGTSALAPVRSFGPPVADTFARKPYAEHQRMLDEGFPSGLQVYWRGAFIDDLSDACIDTIASRFEAITSPLSALVLEHLGGAVSRLDADATAFGHRHAPYNLAIVGRWIDPAERERHVTWTKETSEALRPFGGGAVYVNYLGLEEGSERVQEAYDSQKLARLSAIKREYDPTNLFRVNQNITPAVRDT